MPIQSGPDFDRFARSDREFAKAARPTSHLARARSRHSVCFPTQSRFATKRWYSWWVTDDGAIASLLPLPYQRHFRSSPLPAPPRHVRARVHACRGRSGHPDPTAARRPSRLPWFLAKRRAIPCAYIHSWILLSGDMSLPTLSMSVWLNRKLKAKSCPSHLTTLWTMMVWSYLSRWNSWLGEVWTCLLSSLTLDHAWQHALRRPSIFTIYW